jgi:hypothetical protein
VIISSTALGLFAVLIILLAVRCYITRRRRKEKVNRHREVDPADKEYGISIVDSNNNNRETRGNNNQPSTTIAGDRTGSTARLGGRNAERVGGGGFNSMDMVVPRDVLTSMTLSLAGSPSTVTNNPPPPYVNTNQGGSEPQGLVVPQRTMSMNRSSSFNGTRAYSVPVPVEQSSPQVMLRNASTTGLQVELEDIQMTVTEGGEVGGMMTLARLLPSTATVQYTLTPTSPDELGVKRGDQLKILGIFDDGWCLCRTEEGRRGVVPMVSLGIFRTTVREKNME